MRDAPESGNPSAAASATVVRSWPLPSVLVRIRSLIKRPLDLYASSLAKLGDEDAEDLAFYIRDFGVGVVISLILLQLAEWSALTYTQSHLVMLLASVPGLLFSAFIIAVLVHAYLQTRSASHVALASADRQAKTEKLVVSAFCAATIGTVLIPLVAFVGLTCSLSAKPIGLWSTENDYFWHLMNSVPLIHVTDELHWAEPNTHMSPQLRVLLIMYQIVVIVPFLGLGVAAVRIVRKNLPSIAKYWRDDFNRYADQKWQLVYSLSLMLGSIAFWWISIFTLRATVPNDSPVQRYLTANLAEHTQVFSHRIPLHWIHEVVQIGVASILVAGGLVLSGFILGVESTMPIEKAWSKVRAVGSYVAVLGLVILISATEVFSLVAAGVSRLSGQSASRVSFSAYVGDALWHDARALPVIDLPDGLGWTRAVSVTDSWSGIVFLLQVCISIIVVTIPIALLFSGSRRSE